MRTRHQLRHLHRALVLLAALPMILTPIPGSLCGLLSDKEIEAFWLMKLHTGNFGWINLQPCYSAILGLLTPLVAC